MVNPDRRYLARSAWIALGTALYGEDMRAWRFECPICGNQQSDASVRARNPKIDHTSNWIYFSCEGRYTEEVGCDWTLGGLLRIHRLEVVDDDDTRHPVFEFADDPTKRPPVDPKKWGKAGK